MRRLFIIYISLSVFYTGLSAQELRCEVTVNSAQIAQVDRSIFDALQKSVFEFMNNSRWTDDMYLEEEKIRCQIFINVSEQISTDRYRGTITVQSFRPVYNSSQDALMLNYQDNDFEFGYVPFQQLFWSQGSAQGNLTQVLAFYALYIVALDKESFSLKGGEDVMIEAQNVISAAQNLPEPGWKAGEGLRNRYWMVYDYLSPAFDPLRELMYNYHRMGYDMLYSDMEKGRTQVATSLKTLDQVWTQRPNSFLMQVFFAAKRNEIIDLFRPAPSNAKADLIPILKKIDPAHGSKYDDLNKTQ